MPNTHWPHCDAAWGGGRIEHCPACHLTFAEGRAGDAHRVGEHGLTEGPDRRRCLTVQEMQLKVIEKGALKGEPWFAVKTNRYGTEVWGRNQARDARWDLPGHFTEAAAGSPVGDCPGSTLQRVPETTPREAA